MEGKSLNYVKTSFRKPPERSDNQRMDKIPTYILIDQFTGSAAANLAYTMQSFNKAILVGENTGLATNRHRISSGF